jgi:hypothetical protein
VSDDLHTPTSAGPEPPQSDGASALADQAAALAERPEVMVGAAFAGGVFTALILKRLGRR